MLRRDARLFASGVRTAAVGAPRRATVHAQSSSKRAKDRFDLNEALLRDRERIERNKMLPWREKLKQLNEYPWKFFIAFMILWSWLGTYAVPKMKGLKSGEAPSLGTGAVLPDDVKAKTFVTPRFTHLK